jgi:DNA (cytosine-5)-methyltransferase 1
MRGLVVDLFAGGGGASTALEAALGRPVDIALNHDATAIAVHKANHPRTTHFPEDIWSVDPKIAVGRRRVDIIWASPDCTSHSRARGGKPRQSGKRVLAEAVLKWVRATLPRVLFLENVEEFTKWCPLDADGHPIKEREGESFRLWIGKLRLLGYVVEWRVLDASEFGAPTKRRRLFLVARLDGRPIAWPEPTHGPGRLPLLTAASCIDWSIPCPSIFDRKKPLVEKTLARVAGGIRRYVLDAPKPFIVRDFAPTLVQTGYGERPGQAPRALDLHEPMGTLVAGGVKQALIAAYLVKHFSGVYGQPLDRPASTITAVDHHALAALSLAKFRGTSDSHPGSTDPDAPLPTISAGGTHFAQVVTLLSRHGIHRDPVVMVDGTPHTIVDIGLRMLRPHELLRAQFGRFAAGCDLSAATKIGDQVRLIGNSVCPEVAEAIVRANLSTAESEAA